MAGADLVTIGCSSHQVRPSGRMALPPRRMSKGPARKGYEMTRRKPPLETKELKAVLYTRISVDRENQTSIDNQIRECREYARLNGIEIVGEFSDVGKSAFKLEVDRPGFNEAMAVIESGAANHLLVWKLDRMSRNARGFVAINDQLESWGATFGSKIEPWFDTSEPFGFALIFLMATLAQIEAENIRKRILSWHEGRRLNGEVPVGPKPYGYKRPKEGDDEWRKGGALVPDPDERKIVIELAERILGGDQLRSLARDLDERGVPTPNGANGWNHTSIRKIVLSPTTAALTSDGTESDKWQPLIPREQWRELTAMLTDPERIAGFDCGSRIDSHLLTNIARCGGCGESMNSHSRPKGRQYRCKGCGRTIAATAIEARVSEWVLENVTDAKWRVMRAAGKGRDQQLIETLEQEIEELFIDFHSRKGKPGAISADIYNRLNDEKVAELNSALESPAIKLPDVESLRDSWDALSIEGKRMAIVGAIESITVNELPAGVKPTPLSAQARVAIIER
jgi:site-specific DNA recombinase